MWGSGEAVSGGKSSINVLPSDVSDTNDDNSLCSLPVWFERKKLDLLAQGILLRILLN